MAWKSDERHKPDIRFVSAVSDRELQRMQIGDCRGVLLAQGRWQKGKLPMLSDAVRRELDALAAVALPPLQDEESNRSVSEQRDTMISGVYFDIHAIGQVLYIYEEQRFPTVEDLPEAFMVHKYLGGDLRNTARGFVWNFYKEIRDIICNKKRRTGAANLSRRGIGPSCAGLAAFITSKFGVTEPMAVATATYLLIVLLEATKGAFCRVTKEDVGKALGGFESRF